LAFECGLNTRQANVKVVLRKILHALK